MSCCFGVRPSEAKRPRSRSSSKSKGKPPVPALNVPVVRSPEGRDLVLPGCDPVRFLGAGTFGTVVLVRERSTGVLFAAKIMSKKQLVDEGNFDSVITERRVLREAGPHPFVVECHSGFQTQDAVVLVLEYLPGGDMYDLLKKNGCLSESQAKFYIAEILVGLEELHRHSFVFRDLKLENILLDAKGHVRLTDFGLSGETSSGLWNDKTLTDISGTAIYQAPEILQGDGHGRVVDFWALGVLAHVILTGRPPFSADGDRKELYRLIQSKDIDVDSNERLQEVSAEARDFLRQLLQRDPSKRLGSMDDNQASVRAHPFLSGIDWNALPHFTVAPPLPPPLCGPEGMQAADDEVGEGASTDRTSSTNGTGDSTNAASRAVAEKKVFDKLAGGNANNAKNSSGGKRRPFGKKYSPVPSSGLDSMEYKVVNVSQAQPGRVSIGLDFQGVNEAAKEKTWTGTNDDFGRHIGPGQVSVDGL